MSTLERMHNDCDGGNCTACEWERQEDVKAGLIHDTSGGAKETPAELADRIEASAKNNQDPDQRDYGLMMASVIRKSAEGIE